jgi:hypothetical protein
LQNQGANAEGQSEQADEGAEERDQADDRNGQQADDDHGNSAQGPIVPVPAQAAHAPTSDHHCSNHDAKCQQDQVGSADDIGIKERGQLRVTSESAMRPFPIKLPAGASASTISFVA